MIALTRAPLLLLLLGMLGPAPSLAVDADPAEDAIGERLFLETRFAQFFAAHSGGNVNQPLAAGDPVVDTLATRDGTVPNPFAGQAMNCRSCHLVDDVADTAGAGNRTYADFARRSPVPAREDGAAVTARNSPALVNASLAHNGFFLHFDGEFMTGADLVEGTFTGRNFGWLASEHDQAIAHIAKVIREDDGSGDLAQSAGGAYRVVLKGSDSSIPPDLVLPRKFRIDVAKASDTEILDAVARLVDAYMKSLVFSQDEHGVFNGSPFDLFLAKNRLPNSFQKKGNARAFTRHLRKAVETLQDPVFVGPSDGTFELHDQDFVFGPIELAGLKIFLREAPRRELTAPQIAAGGIGNCTACHPAPTFTDFAFHNTGATQDEYDGIHGAGTFNVLAIPDLATRNADPDAFLPASPSHPNGTGRFRAAESLDHPELTDLGLWNIFRNPSLTNKTQQNRIGALVCKAQENHECGGLRTPQRLARAIGLFKTPGLRDLGHSAPYLHTGGKDTIEDVLTFYRDVSNLDRAGTLRNGALELRGMAISDDDIAPLAAFLRSLNEDYQ